MVTWEENFSKSREVYATKERALKGLAQAVKSNKIKVRVNDRVFDSIKEGAVFIGCSPSALNKALKEARTCKGNEVSYV